jgi:hypothetical protein
LAAPGEETIAFFTEAVIAISEEHELNEQIEGEKLSFAEGLIVF